jgi:hypothetical protein
MEYYIERLSANNLADVEKLHTAVYGKTPPANFFVKKYDTAFTGVKYIGFIAYNDQLAPIAYYGVIPCFIKVEDEIVLSAQSGDTMTHPYYRKRGLFIELAKLTYELCNDEGIHILFGFPNQNSLPGFINNLQWGLTETMDCFIIPVNALPLEIVFNKNPLLKNLYSLYSNWRLKKYITPVKRDANSVFSGVLRDTNYLEYKMYSASKFIKIDGVTLWIKINNGLMIGDIGALNNNFSEVMNKLYQLACKLGLRQIQFHTSPGTPLHTLFSGHYKAIPSFPVIFKDLGAAIPTKKVKFTFADIDIF